MVNQVDLKMEQTSDATTRQVHPKNLLMPTFGYPSGVSKNPSYARFDVRDEACRRVGGFKHGQVISDAGREFVVVGVKPDPKTGEARLWVQPQDLGRPGTSAVQPDDLSRYTKVLKEGSYSIAKKVELREASPEEFDAAEDSDGEDALLCYHCHLPVGTKLYSDKDGNPMHGECLAQLTLKDVKDGELEARKKEAAEKQERRKKHAIGWCMECIPGNVEPAASLGFDVSSSDMCGLMLQQGAEGRTAQVVPTINPAANVNLEYLSLALKVRCVEGRELMFSLDPVADTEASQKDRMQEKVFTPAWLNGTSAGEVLFQADYHLKELSMGDCEQPVVGMKSCNDYSWAEDDWRAREWFVVRKAQIQKTKDDVLIPHLKMGVEAREQVMGADGLDDKPLSRPDHPLAKYAQDFTTNFDLIAERKSVVFHLRELAKASVLAKFLVETQVNLDESWLDLAGKPNPATCLEIPQLWNERRSSQIQVQDGQIVDSSELTACKARGVYGGVSFGLSKFALSGAIAARPSAARLAAAPVRAVPSISLSDLRTASALVASLQAAAAPPPPEAAAVAPGAPAAAAPGMPSGMPGMMMRPGAPIVAPTVPMPSAKFPSALASRMKMTAGAIGQLGLGVGAAGKPMPLDPAGVDLNLDGFSLDEPVPVCAEASGPCGAGLAGAFWSNLEGSSEAAFNAEDKKLLKSIFNPNLSDRREEGDGFVPPDFNREYMEQLHALVTQEEAMRLKRTEHFLSPDFCPDEPGPLFPYSWAATHGISKARVSSQALQLCSDFTEDMFDLKVTTPEFEKTTEDGLRFRMYKFGSLDVRTVQEHDGKEVIGAVFSSRSSPASRAGKRAQEQEKIVKVSEYVEVDAAHYRSYIVVETEQGNSIVTEKFADGAVAWDENPEALENRNALAKFIRSWDQSKKGKVTVGEMQAFMSQCEGVETGTSHSARKQYAQGAFNCARGVTDRVDSGFASKQGWRKSEKAKMAKKETTTKKLQAERIAKATSL
jgi:hypothetical protein